MSQRNTKTTWDFSGGTKAIWIPNPLCIGWRMKVGICLGQLHPPAAPTLDSSIWHRRVMESSAKSLSSLSREAFYIDEGLTSVWSPTEAVHVVKEARAFCKTGNLRLHKFMSNNKEVTATIPPEKCAETKDLDMAFLRTSHWMSTWSSVVRWSRWFQVRVVVKKNPLTRRGVLSTVASVYDPLGFVAPFLQTDTSGTM